MNIAEFVTNLKHNAHKYEFVKDVYYPLKRNCCDNDSYYTVVTRRPLTTLYVWFDDTYLNGISIEIRHGLYKRHITIDGFGDYRKVYFTMTDKPSNHE